MDDKTINLQEYKEQRRQQAISEQKQADAVLRQTVMDIANSSPVPTSTISTADDEAVEKVLNGQMGSVVITENRCVCCGKEIEEGRMVCEECEWKAEHMEKKPLPKPMWERSYEERYGKKKPRSGGLLRKLFGR